MPHKHQNSSAGMFHTDHPDSCAAGTRGPVILQDIMLHENLAHFVRERIPERVTNAAGAGAYGTFRVTADISEYTRAGLFSKVGNECRVFVRFSKFFSDQGSADTLCDTRGFAVKFYTEDGNWDLVGSNMPVFFVKDAKKFPDLVHSQKRAPGTHLRDHAVMWDYWSYNPESLHHILMMFSDRGTPKGYRHMHGYGTNIYSFINAENQIFWVKFHLLTQQGIENFQADEALDMCGKNPDFAQEDLYHAIESGNFPEWKLFVQIMSAEEAREYPWNPFDVTKVWLHEDFPLVEVGKLELNEWPSNYFAHVEQAAFSPANVVDGIGFSPDKALQGRLAAYGDAQRYRIGTNYHQLEVNRCPFAVKNYLRDGSMADGSYGKTLSYHPNSFDGGKPVAATIPAELETESIQAAQYSRESDFDHYTQPGLFYTKALKTQEERDALVRNIVAHMQKISGSKRLEIINRQLCHFFRANVEMGIKIAMGLQINIDLNMMSHAKN